MTLCTKLRLVLCLSVNCDTGLCFDIKLHIAISYTKKPILTFKLSILERDKTEAQIKV